MTCDPYNVERIVRVIRMVLDNQSYFKHYLAKAREKYCWENEERKFLEVYRSLE